MWTDDGFDIIDRQRLSHWSTLLEKRCECFEKFCEYSKTVPALSKEETHVGILSGAAWSLGWVGFQEMSRDRIRRVVDNNDGQVRQRQFAENCDLYICDSERKLYEYVECKKSRYYMEF